MPDNDAKTKEPAEEVRWQSSDQQNTAAKYGQSLGHTGFGFSTE